MTGDLVVATKTHVSSTFAQEILDFTGFLLYTHQHCTYHLNLADWEPVR